MESFIKKIFNGKIDEDVHLQFQKFSKGEFKNRAMISAKNSSGKFSINTTSEYARELVKIMGEKLGNEKTHVSGVLISTLDLDFLYEKKISVMGTKKYVIDREMSGKEILELCDKYNKAFFGLSFNVGNDQLKIKAKLPKSSKNIGEDSKINFCNLKTQDKNIVESLIFDEETKNFKKIEIKHDFIIEEIVIPKELKNEKDFSKIREKALRKGLVKRYINFDGKSLVKEKSFVA